MGVCYWVKFKLFKNNEEACEIALKEYLKKMNINYERETFEDMMRALLLADSQYTDYEKQNDYCYISSFEENCEYETILVGAFYAMSPYLNNGSIAYIEPDDIYYLITMHGGRCINTQNANVRNLCEKDIADVEEMDEVSGFKVLEFLQEYVESGYEEADNCFGIFYDDEMIGYCSLGCAGGIIEALVNYNDLFLSNVYIKEEWRNMCFVSKLIREVTDNLHNDCYVILRYNELEKFYTKLGFEKLEIKNNVMVKYHS